MKKIKSFIRLLSLTLFGLIGFSIISCENTTDIPSIESSSPTSEPIHTHEWDEGEVTKEATCIEEGQITYSCTSCDEVKFETISALGHNEVIDNAVAPTCTETGLTEGKHCDRCNEVLVQQEEISSLGHSFADWTIVKEATCESQGTKRRDCNNCDHYEEETIEAKGHNYESVVTKPTCVEQGYETFTCTYCNHSYIDNYVDALGHNTGELVAEVPATCTSKGKVAHYYCDVCNSYLDTNKNKIDSIDIPMKEHNVNASIYHYDATGHWNECNDCKERSNFTVHTPNISNPTETDDVICTICDYVIEHALGHTHVMQYTEKVEATCETNGNIAYYQCKGCKKYYLDENGIKEIKDIRELVISSLGHNYGKLVEKVEATCEEEGTKAHYHCDRCDKYFNNNKVEINDLTIPALGHKEVTDKAVNATCTETGLTQGSHCSTCNKVLVKQEVIPALGHNEVIDAGKEATCTETGLTEGKHCNRCGEVLVKQEVIPALGHNEVIDTKIDATCEDTGLTEGKHCDRCNEVLVAQKVIPAKGHTEVTDKAVNATCTETGLTEGSHCSVCDKVLVKQEVIPALGHVEVIDEAKEATCTETGLTEGNHCDRCGEVLVKQEIIPALGHKEVIDNAVAPTCTSNGLTEGKHCEVCEQILVYQQTILATGHNEVIIKAISPTCEETGLTEGKYCSKCNETLVEQIVLEALGHDYESVVTNPTCVDNGYTTHTCNRCDDSYVDSYVEALGHRYGDWVVTVESGCESVGTKRRDCEECDYYEEEEIAALGHNEVIDEAKEATCTETGLTQGSHCDRCKEVLVAQKEVAALGHDYESVVTNPTCVDKGYTTHTCNRCDDSYVDSYVEALGHRYGDWKVTVEPGCESVGTKRRDCEACDYYEEEEIAALGHVEVIDEAIEPTCTETGLTEGSHCDRCDEVLVAQEEVDALGHEYESVVTNPTCVEQGYTTHTCNRCEDSYIDSYVEALGHSYTDWVVTNEPGCESVGTKHRDCDECDHYEEEEIAALGHVEVIDKAVEPTCTETGLTEGSHCDKCKEVLVAQEVVDALGHDYESVVTEPTCEEQGYTTHTCSRCNDSYVDSYTKAIGHDFDIAYYWEEPNSTNGFVSIVFTCKNNHEHVAYDADCNSEVTSEVIIEATCEEQGLIRYTVSGFYYKPFSATYDKVTPALGHNEVIDEGKEATCIETGLTDGKHCDRCNKVLVEQEVITYVDHKYVDGNCFYCDCTEGLEYQEYGNGYKVSGIGTATANEIIIPSMYKGLPVTSIGHGAFEGCNSLTSIIIPNSVTCIEYKAFSNCISLTDIILSNTVTCIGNFSFEGCSSLTSISIPDSVTSIGDYAFYKCSSLKEISIGYNVTSIGNSTFEGCSVLESIILPLNVTSIGNHAFYECSSLINITIQNNVKDIKKWSFAGCSSLTSISIPDSVNIIDDYAFYKCSSLKEVSIGDSVTSIGNHAFYKCSSLKEVSLGDSVTSIGNHAFYDCSSLINITIQNNVRVIGEWSFYNCTSLKSINIPDSITNIGNYAFQGCSLLEAITIPNSVNSIGKSVFYNCSSLINIIIPNSVTSIGDNAFYGCSSLTSIEIPDSVISIGNSAFSDCCSLVDVNIPNGVTIINKNTFASCKSLINITIPNSVTSISEKAFYICSSLESITIPASITSIGSHAFSHCTSLTNVNYLGNCYDWSLVSVGTNPILIEIIDKLLEHNEVIDVAIEATCTETGLTEGSHCSVCNKVLVAQEVVPALGHNEVVDEGKDATCTEVGLTEGSHCDRCKEVLIAQEEVSPLGHEWSHICNACGEINELYYTEGLKFTLHNKKYYSVSIGTASASIICIPTIYNDLPVTSIDSSAFKGNNSFENIYIPDSITTIGNYSFKGCSSLISIIIPDSVTSIGINAFEDCTSLQNVILSESIVKISAFLFNNCSSLISIKIPNNVSSVDLNAFYKCEALKEIVFPNNLKNIGSSAFSYCATLEKVEIPDSVITIGRSAFSNCESLKEIKLPNGISVLESDLLFLCSSLTNIQIPDSVSVIERGAFEYCESLISITIPNGVTCIDVNTFKDCRSLTSVFIPNTVVEIKKMAFFYCISLKNIEIPNSVTNIGENTFQKCSSLTSITIPDSVTSIGKNAFSSCVNLKNIVVSKNITIINELTFSNCAALTEITIPDGVISIEKNAFNMCNALQSITIPESVTNIGEGIFNYCRVIQKINYTGTCKQWDEITIGDNNNTLIEKLIITNHEYQSIVTNPTCTEQGYTTHTCSYCKDSYIDNYVEKLGHVEITDKAVEPTCTETGLTEGSHCDRCKEVLVAQEVVDALGHQAYIKYPDEEIKLITITSDNINEFASCENEVVCIVCDTVVIEKIDHNYSSEICTVCGENNWHFSGGNGTHENPYLISSAKQLNNIRLFTSANFKVINNIEFMSEDFSYGGIFYNSGKYWEPIDNFSGSLDGNNYSISNLKIKDTFAGETIDGVIHSSHLYGLFSTIDGTVSNLSLSNIDIQIDVNQFKTQTGTFSTSVCVGGLSGGLDGKIINCNVSGNINVTGLTDLTSAIVGGVVGSSSENSIIESCTNNTTINSKFVKTTYSYSSYTYSSHSYTTIGGIVGVSKCKYVKKCYNYGALIADSIIQPYAGGIVGKSSNNVIDYCYNYGILNAYSTPNAVIDSQHLYNGDLYAYAGGIVAYSFETNITNCGNYGDVNSKGNSTNSGGIVARTYGELTIKHCFNEGNVKSIENSANKGISISHNTAGISSDSSGIIDQCYNSGSILINGVGLGDYYAAGIASGSFGKITNCYNSGNIEVVTSNVSTSTNAAGIVTNCSGFVECCYNVGELIATTIGSIACLLYDGTSNYDNDLGIISCYFKDNISIGLCENRTSEQVAIYTVSEEGLKNQSTFVQFDFDNVWIILDGKYCYPQLKHFINEKTK